MYLSGTRSTCKKQVVKKAPPKLPAKTFGYAPNIKLDFTPIRLSAL